MTVEAPRAPVVFLQEEILKESSVRPPLPSVLRDSSVRVMWKLPGNTEVENLQIGIQNIQGLFLEKFPEFDELFPRAENGRIIEERRREAQCFILDHIGTYKKFSAITPGSALHTSGPFKGSFITALEQSFSPWGITFNFKIVYYDTGRYIENGKIYVGASTLSQELNVSKGLKPYLSRVPFIEGRDRSGKQIRLYDEDVLREKIANRLIIPRIDSLSHRCHIEGKLFITCKQIAKEYGVDESTVFGIHYI